jgi:hypothetical protein
VRDPQNPQEQVFGADIGVSQQIGFLGGGSQYSLRVAAERYLDGGREHRGVRFGVPFDVAANTLQRHPRLGEEPPG